jgi:hypothetical protein
MTKVFIVNRGCHDHSDAERFGKIVYLSEGAVNRYAVANIYRQFVAKLKESEPGDYILLTGLSVMSSLACSIFARIHGRLNLLLYKTSRTPGERGHYVDREIMIDELL